MDTTEVDIITATLNQTIARLSKMVQNYEVEIANLTAELLRLRASSEPDENA
jgi:hypothetical protein